MNDPIPPKYKQRDNVLLNGVPSTVLSWPADNEDGKYAQFEQPGVGGSYNRMMGVLGFDKIEDYAGNRIATSLDEPAMSAQAPADTIAETPEEVVVVEETSDETPDTETAVAVEAPAVVEDIPLPGPPAGKASK